MRDAVVAIDVAVLVPPSIAGSAGELNRVLAGQRPDALRLDDTHLAHVTLAQQFVERARLEDLFAELDRILRHEPAIFLRVAGTVVDRGTVLFTIERTPDLHRLHEQIMDALEPFESPDDGAAAFQADGERIRPQDVAWVRNYREEAAYLHYLPHVTIGHTDQARAVTIGAAAGRPIEAQGDRVAVCRLGRFCTCRAVLREWRLGAVAGP